MINDALCDRDRVLVQMLGSIHPLHLSDLLARLVAALSSVTGIAPEHASLAPLSGVRTVDELAQVEWEALSAALARAADLSSPWSCRALIAHLRLFADRAVLHHCLYLARSASTLWLLTPWPVGIPRCRASSVLEQVCREADDALQQGRGCLHAFECAMMTEQTLVKPYGLLQRANACYARYRQALQQVEQIAERLRRSLASGMQETVLEVAPDEDLQKRGGQAA